MEAIDLVSNFLACRLDHIEGIFQDCGFQISESPGNDIETPRFRKRQYKVAGIEYDCVIDKRHTKSGFILLFGGVEVEVKSLLKKLSTHRDLVLNASKTGRGFSLISRRESGAQLIVTFDICETPNKLAISSFQGQKLSVRKD